jgi:protein phosphatase
MVPEERVVAILSHHATLHESGEALLEAANAAGGRDNITVILFRLVDMTSGAHLQQGSPGAVATPQGATHVDGEGGAAATLTNAGVVAPPRRPDVEGRAVTPLRPRRPSDREAGRITRRRWRWRRARAPVAFAVVLGLILAGAYIATQSVYFIGTNSRGLVTIFSGLPYELPGGIKLYSRYYSSGVPASTIPPERRRMLLDNSWRSQANASDLVRSLELGQLAAQ